MLQSQLASKKRSVDCKFVLQVWFAVKIKNSLRFEAEEVRLYVLVKQTAGKCSWSLKPLTSATVVKS